jgi:hypothetical protein
MKFWSRIKLAAGLIFPALRGDGAENRSGAGLEVNERGREEGAGPERNGEKGEMQNAECRMQNEDGKGASRGSMPMERDPAGGLEGIGGASSIAKGTEDRENLGKDLKDLKDGRDGVDMVDEVGESGSRLEPDNCFRHEAGLPHCKGGAAARGDGKEDGGKGLGQATTPPAEQEAAAAWHASLRREVDEWARKVMREGDETRKENRREEEERLGAMEARVRRLEERGRINRDGG